MSPAELKIDFIHGWRLWSDLHYPDGFEVSVIGEFLTGAGESIPPAHNPFETLNVLEVGCGDGRVLRQLAPLSKSTVGVDTNAMLIEFLKTELADRIAEIASFAAGSQSTALNFTVEEMSGTDLKFADETFDLVVYPWSLHQIPDKEKALSEAKRVLVNGGHIVVFGLVPGGEYENVVIELGLDPGAQVNPVQAYEQPLEKMFGKIDAIRVIGRQPNDKKFGFRFASHEDAFSAWIWALNNWHEHSLTDRGTEILNKCIGRNTYPDHIFMNICGRAYLATK